MQLYDCKVRLGGNLYNEVFKRGVTAAEIMVLRVIHGGAVDDLDCLVDVKVSKDEQGHKLPVIDRDDNEERERLTFLYGEALASREHVKSINGIFGPASALPQIIAGIDNTVEAAKPKRKRVAKTPTERAYADLM